MKTTTSLISLALTVMLLGCLPTLNPVYTERDILFDSAMLGVWAQNDSATWEFTKHGSNAYLLEYTDKDGNPGRFIAHLTEIEGTRFLDLYPDNSQTGASGFYNFHLMSIHTIYRVDQIGPELILGGIDIQWLKDFLKEDPQAIPVVTVNNRQLISASTQELREFVVEHQERFSGEIKLQRPVQ